MKKFIRKIIIISLLILLGSSTSFSQAFDITGIGELNLENDVITAEGQVTKYFGMNVTGLGDSFIRVTVGEFSFTKDYEFKLSETQMFSYFFASDFVDRTSVAFRRGVSGNVKIEILDSNGVVQDSGDIVLNVDFGKKNCKKHLNSRLQTCLKLNLDKATKAQQKLLAKRFLSSIKGPIVLEP